MATAARPTPAPPPGPPLQTSAPELQRIPLSQLVESPWNPRKHFDPAKLAETAESLRVNGQLTPITVRPMVRPRGEVTPYYEIGAGQRRYRAAKLAGLTSLLAVVQPLDDVAFLELLTVENKQRDDVEPLDEAAGFRMLMEKAGYDVQKLANRIGLSKEYVYGRLKLLNLIPELKKLLDQKVITPGHGVLLARLTPSDQKRVMGDPKRTNRYDAESAGGLFQGEYADHDPEQPGLELKAPVKARSVRELATYINDHVRFRPEENDLPNLFPAAAVALMEAKTDDLDPVYITYDHQLKYDAKDHKVRTYGVSSWRRADGKQKSKTCAWSRIGIVAAGRDRGDAFRVCVNRDKCDMHFAAARRGAKRRVTERTKLIAGGTDPERAAEVQREREQEREQEEQRRCDKATPAILKALATQLTKAPAAGVSSPAGQFLLGRDGVLPYNSKQYEKYIARGKTADDLVRFLTVMRVAEQMEDWYDVQDQIAMLKRLGVDARKIIDEVAPKPKKPAAKTPAKKKGARR